MSTPQPPSNPHAVRVVTRDENWVAQHAADVLDVRSGKVLSMVRTPEAVAFILATTTIATMAVFLVRSTDDGLTAKDLPVTHIINDEWQASKSYAYGAASGLAVGVLGVAAMNQFHPGGKRVIQASYDIIVTLDASGEHAALAVDTDVPVPLRDIGDGYASPRYNVRFGQPVPTDPKANMAKATITAVSNMLAVTTHPGEGAFRRLGASRWAFVAPNETRRYILTPNDRDVASAVFNVVTKPVFWGSESADALIYDQHQSPISPQGREVLQLLCGRTNPAMPYVRDDWYRLSRGLQREMCQRSSLWAPQSDNDFHLDVLAGSPQAAVALRYMVNRKPEFYLRHSLDRALMNEEVLYTEIEYQHGRLRSAITAEHGGAFLLLDDDTRRRLKDLWGIDPPKPIELRGVVADATRQLARRRIEYMISHGGLLASKVNVQCGGECRDASLLSEFVDRGAAVSNRIAGVLKDRFQIHVAPAVTPAADGGEPFTDSEMAYLRLVSRDNNTVLLHHVAHAAGQLNQKLKRFVPPRKQRVTANELEEPAEIGQLNRIGQRIVRVEQSVGSDSTQQMFVVTEPTVIYAVTTEDFANSSDVVPIAARLVPEATRVLGDATMTPYAYFGAQPPNSLWFLDPTDQRELVDRVAEAFARGKLAPHVSDDSDGKTFTVGAMPTPLTSAVTLLRKMHDKLKDVDFDPRTRVMPPEVANLYVWPRKNDFVATANVPKRLICVHGQGEQVKACDYVFAHHKCYTAGYATYVRCHEPNEYYVPGGNVPDLGEVEVQNGKLRYEVMKLDAMYVSDGQNVTPAEFKPGDQVTAAYPSDGIVMAMISDAANASNDTDFGPFLNWLVGSTGNSYAKDADNPPWYNPGYTAVENSQESTWMWDWHNKMIKLLAEATPELTTIDKAKATAEYNDGKFGYLYGIIPSQVRAATTSTRATAAVLDTR